MIPVVVGQEPCAPDTILEKQLSVNPPFALKS